MKHIQLYNKWMQDENQNGLAELFLTPISEYGLVIENADITEICSINKTISLTFNKNKETYRLTCNRVCNGTDIDGIILGFQTIEIRDLSERLIVQISAEKQYCKSINFVAGKLSKASSSNALLLHQ